MTEPTTDNTLPEPLGPPGVDLREYGFMPLDVIRLRDSGLTLHASGDEFRAAVLLWSVSWHQIPAGSLPNNDDELAHFVRGSARNKRLARWERIRDGALRGWIECSDGRLYHPVVAEKVLEAWGKRTGAKKTGKAGAEKRWGNKDASVGSPSGGETGPAKAPIYKSDGSEMPPHAGAQWASDSKGEKNKGEENKDRKIMGASDRPLSVGPSSSEPDRLHEAKAMWPPKRWTHEVQVRNLWTFAIPKAGSQQALLDGIQHYLASVDRGPDGDDGKFVEKFVDWLKAERWGERLPASKTPFRALQLPPEVARGRGRARRVVYAMRGFGQGPWEDAWGDPPTKAEIAELRERWYAHVSAVDAGRERYDETAWGSQRPTLPEITAAREWRDRRNAPPAPPEARP